MSPKIPIPCGCEAEEHELQVLAEVGGYGIHARNGIHSPRIGDPLPCGRRLTSNDLDVLFQRLDEYGRTDE